MKIVSVCPEIGSIQDFAKFRGGCRVEELMQLAFRFKKFNRREVNIRPILSYAQTGSQTVHYNFTFATSAADYAASRLLCAEAA
jgi:hypothetical protein